MKNIIFMAKTDKGYAGKKYNGTGIYIPENSDKSFCMNFGPIVFYDKSLKDLGEGFVLIEEFAGLDEKGKTFDIIKKARQVYPEKKLDIHNSSFYLKLIATLQKDYPGFEDLHLYRIYNILIDGEVYELIDAQIKLKDELTQISYTIHIFIGFFDLGDSYEFAIFNKNNEFFGKNPIASSSQRSYDMKLLMHIFGYGSYMGDGLAIRTKKLDDLCSYVARINSDADEDYEYDVENMGEENYERLCSLIERSGLYAYGAVPGCQCLSDRFYKINIDHHLTSDDLNFIKTHNKQVAEAIKENLDDYASAAAAYLNECNGMNIIDGSFDNFVYIKDAKEIIIENLKTIGYPIDEKY